MFRKPFLGKKCSFPQKNQTGRPLSSAPAITCGYVVIKQYVGSNEPATRSSPNPRVSTATMEAFKWCCGGGGWLLIGNALVTLNYKELYLSAPANQYSLSMLSSSHLRGIK